MNEQSSIRSMKTYVRPDRFIRLIIPLIMIMGLIGIGTPSQAAASPWPNSTPEKQGMDSKTLLDMMNYIDGMKSIHLHSLLVIRHGTMVLEEYFPPFDALDRHIEFSLTKSFTSALVGIAIQEDYIQSVDQPVLDFFQDDAIENMSEAKQRIHIHDLLNMNSGLFDGFDASTSSNYALAYLNQPMVAEPGTLYSYNNYNPQVLSEIILRTTGKNALEYANEKLFGPLSIKEVYWEADPSGTTTGGYGLYLTPRDMAKLGQLYVQNGAWEGKQIISPEWIEDTFTPTDNGRGVFTSNSLGHRYFWWQYQNGYGAWGYGGQLVLAQPSLDLVVVCTGGLPMDVLGFGIDITDAYIVPSIKSDHPLPKSKFSKALARRLAEIANPKAQPVPTLPAMASLVSGKTISLDENPSGWKMARLEFIDKKAWLTITTAMEAKEKKFEIGLDGVYRVSQVKKVEIAGSPIEYAVLLGAALDGEVGMKGEWVSEVQFVLTAQDTRNYEFDQFVFSFAPPDVQIHWISQFYGDFGFSLVGSLE